MFNLTRQSLQLLRQRWQRLPPEVQAEAQQVLSLEGEILKRFRALCERRINAYATLVQEMRAAFERADFSAIIRLMDRHFGAHAAFRCAA